MTTPTLFDLVKTFDQKLGSATAYSNTSPEFVIGIFSTLLHHTRSSTAVPTLYPSTSTHTTATPSTSKPPKTPKTPKKAKQPKTSELAQQVHILSQWHASITKNQPPAYSTCRDG
jgi:hypothetical protein